MADTTSDPATPGANPTADLRQQINQQNAQHSTGPRTPEGKAASSRNATRHGLCSSVDVLPGVESPEEWEEFRTGLLAELAPVGSEETRLAERVAHLYWQLRRIERYEAEAFARELDPETGSGFLPEKVIAQVCRYGGYVSRELRQARQALSELQKARRTRERTERYEKEGGIAGAFARLGQEVKPVPAPAPTPPAPPPPPDRRLQTAAEIKAELKKLKAQTQELVDRGTASGPQPGVGSFGKNAPAASDASGSVGSFGQRQTPEAPGSASPPA